jgi:hypothetical protein
MVALTGCRLDVDVATVVGADGSGTVTVTLRADRELVEAAPGVVADVRFDDAGAAGWTVTGPTATDDGGATATLTKPFASPAEATAVLAEVTGAAGPLAGVTLAQERSFAQVTTTVNGQAVGPTFDAFADPALVEALGGVPLADRVTPEQLAAGLGMTVRFTLPGTVTAANGTVSGNSVAWQPSMAAGAVTPIAATSELRDDEALAARDRERWAGLAFWVWIAVAAAGIAVVVALLARHRRRRAA